MDKEQKAIERIKLASEQSLFHYGKPLIVTYSGGKDSDVLLEMFKRSGVPFTVSNSHTTVDAPQTVYHIRNKFKELEQQGVQCDIDYHIHEDGSVDTMWNLIPRKKIPPTRLARWCCNVLKEQSHPQSFVATGVRWAESTARRKRAEFERITPKKKDREIFESKMLLENNDTQRRVTELCMQKKKMVVNPIIDWTDSEVWDFLNSEHIETNPLYQCGYDRVGCIGCPMAGKHRWTEFADFPIYKDNYIKAFDKMLLERKRQGADDSQGAWRNAESLFHWWMEDDWIEGQITIDEYMSSMEVTNE